MNKIIGAAVLVANITPANAAELGANRAALRSSIKCALIHRLMIHHLEAHVERSITVKSLLQDSVSLACPSGNNTRGKI